MGFLKSIIGILRSREFWMFFGGSAAGLAVDLLGFQVLVSLGLEPWLANGISSFVSISVVYLLVTRYSFGVGTRVSTYILFVAWYSASIILFSTLIQLAVSSFGGVPFLWKLATVPVSFGLNYLFSRFLFLPRQRRDAAAAGDAEPTDDEPDAPQA